ncbi:MAG: hypothetical protein DLM60_17370 [Pseudonocardiales bacterium]|nr:MAG: hypothetical protein DLM60_17370 [Pseudonocardiales bacterium]
MVDVLAIHGINMHRSRRVATAEAWRTSIVDGLVDLRSGHAESLSVEFAFYGHLYNDGKSDAEAHYTAADVEPGFQTELIEAVAAGVQNESEQPADTKLWLPSPLQRALAALQRSRLFDGCDSLLISFVKQVDRYVHDTDFRADVLDEVAKAMQSSPHVVIAHSLGSVIAYDWLQHNEPPVRPGLLTLGSPLGFEAIRRRLDRPADRSRWPGTIRSWTNIAAHHDAVAMVKKLAPLYHPDIVDEPCDNPRRSAHAALCYLGNIRTARTIDKALDAAQT